MNANVSHKAVMMFEPSSSIPLSRSPLRGNLSGIIVPILLFLFLSTSPLAAATIEIHPGDSFETAAENLKPGDTLIVHQGTYSETGRIGISVKGTTSSPVVIRGAAGESTPVITRPSTSPIQNTVDIDGATYLTIKGLELTGNGGDGIFFGGPSSYINLEDLDIHDVDVGIGLYSTSDHITVRNTRIHRTGRDNGNGEGMYVGCNNATCVISYSLFENNWIHDSLPGTAQGDGIEVKVGSHSNILRNNVIYNRTYPGIFVYGGGSGTNIVEGNVIWNTLEGIYAVADAIVQNNIVMDSGLGISSYPHVQVAQMKNVRIVNNTLYNNDDGLYIRWGTVSNMVLANNAVFSPGKTAVNTGSGVGATGITARSNFVEGSMGGDSIDNLKFFSGGTTQQAFVDAPNRDLWPRPGSALIGTAYAAPTPPLDFNERSRLAPFDVGAYDTDGLASNPGWKIVPGFKGVGRNTFPPNSPTSLIVR